MIYRTLGTSGIKISAIGFGCMSLKGNTAENEKLLQEALAQGINYFDTANVYDQGENETLVGKALKEKRTAVVIATKVGNQLKPGGNGFDWNPTKKHILTSIDESLRRLQTDYIDLYQLHGGTLADPISETIEAFELLKQQGKIRAYGISSIRPNVINEYIKRSSIASVMMQYSLLDRRPEEACLPLLLANNISVLARGSVAGGLLINKPPKAYLNYTPAEVEKAAASVKQVSGEMRSEAQSAIQFVLGQPAVTSAIVGIRTQKQLHEAVATLTTPQLTFDELLLLKQSVEVNFYEQHR